jgi:hypothetical protein
MCSAVFGYGFKRAIASCLYYCCMPDAAWGVARDVRGQRAHMCNARCIEAVAGSAQARHYPLKEVKAFPRLTRRYFRSEVLSKRAARGGV